VTIPLVLSNAQGVPLGTTRSFTAVLSFNSTLLIPQQPFASKVLKPNGDLAVTYNGSTNTVNGTIYSPTFLAALGDDSCTDVIIDTFFWDTPNISVNRVPGQFCLTNICIQGGPQLIDPNGTVSISAPKPNPGSTSISIDYHLIEKGQTTITVYDVLGHEAMQLVNVNATPGSYTVTADVSSLPAGTYIYSLRTPSTVTSNYLKIAR
ncbi:MAG TPA: T9SS type A sorting domain-containing protein, partial [Candidatus Kapabacteria bacterium]